MAAYQTGTVRVTAGSSKVFGTGTEWNTYIATNDLFQRTTENTFYDIAAVNSATQITLTSRYTSLSLQSAVASNFASVNTATVNYSGNTGSFTPVIQNNFVLVASPNGGGERFTDNGAGILTGEGSPAGSGTIDYDSGTWTIVFGTALTATLNLSASFNRGNQVDGAGYQIVSDFTPNYQIPEMSTNDVNFSHIYTKAMRKIDQKILAASGNPTGSVVTASHFLGQVSATFANAGIVNASITNASITNVKLNGEIKTKIIPKKVDYEATSADNMIVVGGNAASVHITLPYSSNANRGIKITLINNSVYTTVASCRTSETIEGDSKIKLLNQYDTVTVVAATLNLWVGI